MDGRWARYADQQLAELFVRGQPAPTKQQITDAYPFGERRMHPYKVWLARVKVWKMAHAAGLSSPFGFDVRARHGRDPGRGDKESLNLFAK